MEKNPIKYRPLTPADEETLNEDRIFPSDVVETNLPELASEDPPPSDFLILQQIFSTGPHTEAPDQELVALGTVLGDLIADELGMSWVRVRDMHGETLALHYPKTLIFLYPREMIIKRVQENRDVNFEELFQETCSTVREMINSSEYREES